MSGRDTWPYVVLCIPDTDAGDLDIDSSELELAFGPFLTYREASDELEEMRDHDCGRVHVITLLAAPYT